MGYLHRVLWIIIIVVCKQTVIFASFSPKGLGLNTVLKKGIGTGVICYKYTTSRKYGDKIIKNGGFCIG